MVLKSGMFQMLESAEPVIIAQYIVVYCLRYIYYVTA